MKKIHRNERSDVLLRLPDYIIEWPCNFEVKTSKSAPSETFSHCTIIAAGILVV